MSGPPLFSIITPTYQGARFIPRCHWSLLQQQVGDWEWVVVDDASTDGTREIIKSLGDERIRYFRFETNQGRGLARDHALHQARGQWSVILDMDDLCFPDRLTRAREAQLRGEAFLCSPLALIDDAYRLCGVRGFTNTGYPRSFPHATLCGGSDLLRKIGYPPYRRAQDQTMVLTLANNFEGYYHPEPLYIYHENAGINLSGAIIGNYYKLRQSHDLTCRGVLQAGGGIYRMQISYFLKMIGLMPMFIYPPLYKLTLKRRANLGKNNIHGIDTNRRRFINECANLFPVSNL